MIVRSVGALSVGKMFAILHGAIGLLAGAGIVLLAMLGLLTSPDGGAQGSMAFVFGAGALVSFPLVTGVVGFISGLVGALIYNVVAGIVGGIALNIE